MAEAWAEAESIPNEARTGSRAPAHRRAADHFRRRGSRHDCTPATPTMITYRHPLRTMAGEQQKAEAGTRLPARGGWCDWRRGAIACSCRCDLGAQRGQPSDDVLEPQG